MKRGKAVTLRGRCGQTSFCMKILINGNLGYIGPVAVSHFRKVFPKAEIIGFDSGFFAHALIDPEQFPDEKLDAQFFGDVRKLPDEVLQGVDCVVQLAAISNDPMGNAFEKVTEEINTVAVVEVAKRAKSLGAKSFIFASSCSVYGAGGEEAKSEFSALNPLTAYARSKIAAESALEPLACSTFKITSLRFATACGFSSRIRLDLVLNDFVASALATGKVVVLSDGTPWRPLIHVKDMARAIEWAIVRPPAEGHDYLVLNVGADNWNYRVRELAESVCSYFGNIKLSINTHATPDTRSYRVDFGLFANLAPKHLPEETLLSAVQDIAEGLRTSGFADAEFRKSNYIRLKVLGDLRKSGRLSETLYWT